jgi:hypothetical protein
MAAFRVAFEERLEQDARSDPVSLLRTYLDRFSSLAQ